jgi:hypothetical protein
MKFIEFCSYVSQNAHSSFRHEYESRCKTFYPSAKSFYHGSKLFTYVKTFYPSAKFSARVQNFFTVKNFYPIAKFSTRVQNFLTV